MTSVRIVRDARKVGKAYVSLDGFNATIDCTGDLCLAIEGLEADYPNYGQEVSLTGGLRSMSRGVPATHHDIYRLDEFGYLMLLNDDARTTTLELDVEQVIDLLKARQANSSSSSVDEFASFTRDLEGTYVGTSLMMSQLAGSSFRESATFAPAEDVLLVIGPPRCGKTTGIINPNIAFANGPVVSTSTKSDVLEATGMIRQNRGQVWVYDPTGKTPIPEYAKRVNWTPIHECDSWDATRAIAADLMDTQDEPGTMTNQSFWTGRGKALLAPLLRLAYLRGAGMHSVVASLGSEAFQYASTELRVMGEESAANLLDQLERAGGETLGSISNTAAGCLDAWAGDDPGISEAPFDMDQFIRSTDTVYVVGSGFDQAAIAPAIASFVGALARRTYDHWHRGDPRVLFALDEVANIAPIGTLPAIMSEGGGQGIQLILCFQDYSQIRRRWPKDADGFNTLARNILVFAGVRDIQTLTTLSALTGESHAYTISHHLAPNAESRILNPLSSPALSPEMISGLSVSVGDDFRALLFDADGWTLQQIPAVFSMHDLAQRIRS